MLKEKDYSMTPLEDGISDFIHGAVVVAIGITMLRFAIGESYWPQL